MVIGLKVGKIEVKSKRVTEKSFCFNLNFEVGEIAYNAVARKKNEEENWLIGLQWQN